MDGNELIFHLQRQLHPRFCVSELNTVFQSLCSKCI